MSGTLYSLGRLPAAVDMVEVLRERLGWEPRYWITQPDLHDAVARRFAGIVRHPFRDANRGLVPAGCESWLGTAVEPALLERFATLEYTVLRIIDRHVLADSLSPAARRMVLYRQLGYCLRVLDAFGIERFVLNATPHSIIDICFYFACRIRGAEVRMLHLTGLHGRQVVLADAQGAPLGLDATLRAIAADPPNAPVLSSAGRAELAALRETATPDDPWYVTAQQEREAKLAHLYEAADLLLEQGIEPPCPVDLRHPIEVDRSVLGSRRLGRPGATRRSVNIFARRFAPKHDEAMERTFARPGAGFAAPQITWREYYVYRDWALLRKRALQRRYAALTEGFDGNRLAREPYVYLPLHYQPERTTCPEGGRFDDQYLVASLVAAALPAGWSLLIKEHPAQFRWQTEGELGRSEDYYAPFLELPRTALVPLDLSSHTLTAHARAVVTVTGMAGWEACVRGRPVIVFGEPWYAGCTGVFRARSAADVVRAFEHIAAGRGPEREATDHFAAVIEAIGRRCYLNPSHAPLYPELDEAGNAAALIDLFAAAESFAASKPDRLA